MYKFTKYIYEQEHIFIKYQKHSLLNLIESFLKLSGSRDILAYRMIRHWFDTRYYSEPEIQILRRDHPNV